MVSIFEGRGRYVVAAPLLPVCLAMLCGYLAAAAPAQAASFSTTATSSAGSHDDYYQRPYFTWLGAGISSVWISGLNCSPCSWSAEKTFNELLLPTITGNIISARLYIDVTGGSGDAWLNMPNLAGLTGDANADSGLVSQYLVNSGHRIATGGSTGWVWSDVTSEVVADYASHRAWAELMLDPVPWSTSMSYGAAGGGAAPYLVITTDSVAAPEPVSVALLGCGLAGLAAARRRRPA